MRYHLSDIQSILGARWLQKPAGDPLTEQLLYDSRSLAAPANALFFALPGKHRDGHRFIPDLYAQGVRQFVVQQLPEPDLMPEAFFLQVPHPLEAIQTLAAHHRSRFQIPVIGITGSNGKTVVKEWLAQLLSPDFDLVRSPKSYNSQIGVPLSVWQMQERNTLAIFEAGISQKAEMEKLERIIRPTIGIFTNLGTAHQEGFTSDAEKLAEKMKLFAHADTLVCEARWVPERTSARLFTWSKNGAEAQLQVISTDKLRNGGVRIQAMLKEQDQSISLQLPFSDDAGIENALHCWAVMLLLHIPQEEIERRMLRLEPVEMRLEVKAAIHHCTLINDAYSNDLDSLRLALQFARQQAGKGPLTLILSDILQSGLSAEGLWKSVATLLQTHKVQRLIGIGAEISGIRKWLPETITCTFYPGTEVILDQMTSLEFRDETILLKGARAFAFERIARRLEEKAHKTVLEVNLSALLANLKTYQRMLQPGTRMMVMVKAEGYGAGSAQVAKLLEFHQVDYLGVAYADEGIALREAGVNLPILVLNPEPTSFDVMHRYRLEPEVYSLELLEEIAGFVAPGKPLTIHLKLDTGMHRLGFEPADIPALTQKLKEVSNIRVASIFSHLSASDAPVHDAFTRSQAEAFSGMVKQINQALGYEPLRHICNTGGIERWPEFHFDMVRLGIGLYGIGGAAVQHQLHVVNTLKATISQIKNIPVGDTVGYNRNSGLLNSPKRTATISIGYADGFLRLAGGGRFAPYVRGKRAQTVGNICMDMTMIDITHIPEAQVGDEVTIFGQNPPVQELAQCLQTIPYEVFTNVADRVKRVYWQE
ncbi:MAG: bifunctional UDP-N-acetylmuramoyl-tripeptide:D-alanyl-D-alanine ligase/alanine racemase [Saprospiraceae bacterium]|nr:bifunctional UDP-N-acetylmuramoyl-tripeptide:D-alanyl-D-alanine ligase/alanine racemase [Saprospiraceae bacterium]